MMPLHRDWTVESCLDLVRSGKLLERRGGHARLLRKLPQRTAVYYRGRAITALAVRCLFNEYRRGGGYLRSIGASVPPRVKASRCTVSVILYGTPDGVAVMANEHVRLQGMAVRA